MRLKSSFGILGACLLVACGGGGDTADTSVAAETIAGKVVDGYIRGATVYWDCIPNATLDSGETSTVTTAGGNFLIAKLPGQNCDLLAYVPASAVDEDNPSAVIGRSYTMAAANGAFTVISPLTTLVAGKLKSGEASSLQVADTMVASQFGLAGSMLTDYKVAAADAVSRSLAAFARLTAKQLSLYPLGTPILQSATSTTAIMGAAMSTPGLPASVKLGFEPFIYQPDPIARGMQAWGVKPMAGLLVLRNRYDATNNALIDAIADELTLANAGEYGVVDFWKLPAAQMQPWVTRWDISGPAYQDSRIRIAALQNTRAQNFKDATTAWKTTIADDTGFLNYMANNPDKALDYALRLGSASTNVAIDIGSLTTGGAPSALRDKFVGLVKANDRLKQIAELRDFLQDSNDCIRTTEALLVEIQKPFPDSAVIRPLIPKVFIACQSLLPNTVKDATLIATKGKTKTELQALLATKQLLVVAKDLSMHSSAIPNESLVLTHLKILKSLTEVYKDILSLVMAPTPGLASTSAGVDLIIQGLEAYIVGAEIGSALTMADAATFSSAEKFYQAQTSKYYLMYYAAWLSGFSDFFRVVDPATDTYVSSVSATSGQVTVGVPALITVKGGNLPASAVIGIEGGVCSAPTGAGATSISATCTVSGGSGERLVSVLSKSASVGGELISDVYSVRVQSPQGVPIGKLNDTGITTEHCYALGSNALVSCSSSLATSASLTQDGMLGRDITNPDDTDGTLGFSFTKLDSAGNELPASATAWTCVRDNLTGLYWEVKTSDLGLHGRVFFTNNGDGSPADSSSFVKAVNAERYCGFDDWRVATISELAGLWNYGGVGIDTRYFPNNNLPSWSGGSFLGDQTKAFRVFSGTAGAVSKLINGHTVILVRSTAYPQPSSVDRYVVLADTAEVRDKVTGLTWRRCSEGQIWDGTTCVGTALKLTFAGAFGRVASQPGWRLPNIKELASLIDTQTIPAVNATAFPGNAFKNMGYWSSTPLVNSPDTRLWILFASLDGGGIGHNPNDNLAQLLLVRD